MEENKVLEGINTIEDIEKRKSFISTVWETFPDLCKAITEAESREDYTPDMGVVVNMLLKDEYVRKAIDKKLEIIKTELV